MTTLTTSATSPAHQPSAQETAKDTFFSVLRTEAAALAKLPSQISLDSANAAIDLLASCTAKIVVSGVGKSGLIGQKICATFNSFGMVSAFLHPNDALHGDFGMVAQGDVALLLSNSGETAELLCLLPSLKRRVLGIIALVGNPTSTLARQSNIVLDSSVEREACTMNIAPTASTAVALAIGDALAVAVAERKKLSLETFAVNHPGGRIGKRLTMHVADLMHGLDQNPTVAETTPLVEVVNSMCEFRLGGVNVVSANGSLLGLITDGDLRRAIQRFKPEEWPNLKAVDVMTRNPVVVDSELNAFQAMQIMENRASQISVIPVVTSEGRCVGLLRLHDIVQAGL
jgi:arabinose-5-phosphate isomerase